MKKETKTLKAGRKDLLMVPVNSLQVKEGFNVRVDYGDVEELKESIKENGVLMPLRGHKVRGEETYVITDGHRRTKAIMLLVKEDPSVVDVLRVPFVLEDKTYNDEKRVLDMMNCNTGKNLNTLEQAFACERLVNYGYKPSDIAKKTGKTPAHISNLLKLLSLPKTVKDKIMSGEISSTLALQIAREEKNPEDVVDRVENAVATAKEEGKTKATKKHSEGTTKLSLPKALKGLEARFEEAPEGYNPEKVAAVKHVIAAVKDGKSIDDILEYFKAEE